MTEFNIFKSEREQAGWPKESPPMPPWRKFTRSTSPTGADNQEDQQSYRGRTYCPTDDEVRAVNAAIHLRRPLLLTGDPGCGKSSLAYAIAWRLDLGEVLYWPINSQTTVKDGLYHYDAISRLRDANLRTKGVVPETEVEPIQKYLSLGALGTALAPRPEGDQRPRILLIDELDKSDVDLPNDLLDLFEEGCFDIDELVRIKDQHESVALQTAYRKTQQREERITVTAGHVQCDQFPIVVITSNQERQFPPAFLRRCLRHDVKRAASTQLEEMIEQHGLEDTEGLIDRFISERDGGQLKANDQLLNALFLLNKTEYGDEEKKLIEQLVTRDLKD